MKFEGFDELGPERILHVHDPKTGMRGVVVVDSTAISEFGAGGLRMMPDITTREIQLLARAMTYKYIALELPMGGSKSGIWGDPGMRGAEREAVMKAFGRAAKPLLQAGTMVGSDIGTDATDVAHIYEGAGMPYRSSGLAHAQKDGDPLENHATGYGVVVAARGACEFAGFDLAGASVAIEGFGKAGGGVARYMHEAGARVVALSTLEGTAVREQGLDIPALLEARKSEGDAAVMNHPDVKTLPREALYGLDVDVLVPGSRTHVIHGGNVGEVQARVISSIANVPITDDAEAALHARGVHVVPDFISNGGGVVISIVDGLGGSEADVFRILDTEIARITKRSLESAADAAVAPRLHEIARSREILLNAKRDEKRPTMAELEAQVRERFGF